MNTVISLCKKLIITVILAISGTSFIAQGSAHRTAATGKALMAQKPAARSNAQLKKQHDGEIVTPAAAQPATALKSASKEDERMVSLRRELFTHFKRLLHLKYIEVRDILLNIENIQADLTDLLSLIFKEYTQKKYYTNGARLSPNDMQNIIAFNEKMVKLYSHHKGSNATEFSMNAQMALLSLEETGGLEDTLLKICNLMEHNELKRCNKAIINILKYSDAKKLQTKKIPAPKAATVAAPAAHKPATPSKPQPRVNRSASAFHTATAATAYVADEPDFSSSVIEDSAAAARRKQQEYYSRAMPHTTKEPKPKDAWTSSAASSSASSAKTYTGKTVEQLKEDTKRLQEERKRIEEETAEMERDHKRKMDQLKMLADFQTAAHETERRTMAAMHRTEVATYKAMMGSARPSRSTSTSAACAKRAIPDHTSSATAAASTPNYDGILKDLYKEKRRLERLIAESPSGALGLTMGTKPLDDVKAQIKRYEELNRSIAKAPATATLSASKKEDIERIAKKIADERFAPFLKAEELSTLQRKTKALILQLPTIKPAQLAKLPAKLKDQTFISNLKLASAMLTKELAQNPHQQLNLLNQLLTVLISNNPMLIKGAMQKLQLMPDAQAIQAAQKLTGLLGEMDVNELTVLHQVLSTIFA